ncbi:MAG: adenylate/guanylate cyclase domain-containing protein [Flavobacteriales bacterium]|nr:adenylate/guanylate cyclase domain-containing protein [Flavobacteriales bacterium]
MDRRLGPGASMGRRILVKSLLYTVTFVVISTITLTAFNLLMADWFARLGMEMSAEVSFRWGLTFVPTTLAGNFLISFIKQVNRSFGPGLLMSLLLGRYQKPVRERRIFMFMDLRSSTRHAEELGPERYSSMVRDLFHDVDSAVPTYGAEIYQYVGDEVVFTWNADDTPDKERCLHFHFAICDAITQRAEHYLATYGRVPEFKAGLHLGEVVAVEIGEIKREIAYHGDTINTAARIQSMCNEMGRALIISETLLAACTITESLPLRTIELGSVLLKGKQQHVAIHAVERSSENMEPLHDRPSTFTEV